MNSLSAWILIVVVHGNSAQPITVNFDTETLCKEAKEKVVVMQSKYKKAGIVFATSPVSAECLETGL